MMLQILTLPSAGKVWPINLDDTEKQLIKKNVSERKWKKQITQVILEEW